jgi:dihydrofolate reductase
MLVELIAAISSDGFIARHSSELVDWSSREDKQFFVSETKRIGTMVMGRTTFETIGRALPGRRMIVLTSSPESYSIPDVEFTAESPEKLLARLQAEGVETIAVTGGARVYTQFLNEGLVDRLLLTHEDVLLGEGIQLTTEPIIPKLALKESRYLSEATSVHVFDVLNG